MEKLASYLEANGETQSDFAARIGVDQSVVNKYLRQGVKPTIERALLIAKVTNNEVPVEAWGQS